MSKGRFAPSPTGWLHLGNAWSFLLAWLQIRSLGGTMVYRTEDLDLERCSAVYMQAVMRDLTWLGLDWDEGPTLKKEDAFYHQSNRYRLYDEAIATLRADKKCYPCFCSRKDVRGLASAPHIGDMGAPYPGTCRNLTQHEVEEKLACGLKYSWRFRSDETVFCFEDGVYGTQQASLADCGGDFNLQRSDGVYSYQLAVSVDDGLMGVTHVLRGRDLLPSTPRQIAILQALGYPVPHYTHIPLLLDEEGERLAKRHASISLEALRNAGVSPWRIVGLLARIAGLIDSNETAQPQELISVFDIDSIARHDYQITAADMSWLKNS